jgi:hypothetical protein
MHLMNFSANQDVDIMQADLFENFVYFNQFEGQAIQRGATFAKQGSLISTSGLNWKCEFILSGH